MLALLSAVVFFIVFPAVIAVVLGIVALRKMKKTTVRKGRGLAIAGVIIGVMVAVGGLAFDVMVGSLFSTGTSYRDLKVGDCLDDPGGRVFRVTRHSCSGSHERQVFATFDDPASSSAPFPGTTPLRTLAEGECVSRFARIASSVPNRSALRVFFLVPIESSWKNDDNRRVVCMVGNRDGSLLTGSLPTLDR